MARRGPIHHRHHQSKQAPRLLAFLFSFEPEGRHLASHERRHTLHPPTPHRDTQDTPRRGGGMGIAALEALRSKETRRLAKDVARLMGSAHGQRPLPQQQHDDDKPHNHQRLKPHAHTHAPHTHRLPSVAAPHLEAPVVAAHERRQTSSPPAPVAAAVARFYPQHSQPLHARALHASSP